MNCALISAWERTLRLGGSERAVAQAGDGATATFRELDTRSSALAASWLGAAPPARFQGHAVVFAERNGIGWLELFLSILKSGAVAVPLDSNEPPAAQRRVAENLRAAFVWDGATLAPLARPKRWRDPEIRLIKTTSGTTGQPRALAFTAGELLADARQVLATMGIGRRDLNYAMIPLGHSYGLGNLTIPLIARGVPLVCASAALPHAIAADFERWRPTVFPGVPSVWRALAASDAALPGLRLGISAGSPLPAEVARDFSARFGLRLRNFYGSTETGGIAYDRTGLAGFQHGGGVGRALRGVKIAGLGGSRIQVSSAAVFTHGNRRRAGGFGTWIMPDRGALDARGVVTLLGRRGATVKIAGRRVNLAEVAARLRRLPGVRDAWVGAGGEGGPMLGAVVATNGTVADLRARLSADTAPWNIPKRLVAVAALPVNARGKPDVEALRRKVFPTP